MKFLVLFCSLWLGLCSVAEAGNPGDGREGLPVGKQTDPVQASKRTQARKPRGIEPSRQKLKKGKRLADTLFWTGLGLMVAGTAVSAYYMAQIIRVESQCGQQPFSDTELHFVVPFAALTPAALGSVLLMFGVRLHPDALQTRAQAMGKAWLLIASGSVYIALGVTFSILSASEHSPPRSGLCRSIVTNRFEAKLAGAIPALAGGLSLFIAGVLMVPRKGRAFGKPGKARASVLPDATGERYALGGAAVLWRSP